MSNLRALADKFRPERPSAADREAVLAAAWIFIASVAIEALSGLVWKRLDQLDELDEQIGARRAELAAIGQDGAAEPAAIEEEEEAPAPAPVEVPENV